MKYDRFVHIIKRGDEIKCVLTSGRRARKLLVKMRDAALPKDHLTVDYMKRCMDEHSKWRVEQWPLNKSQE